MTFLIFTALVIGFVSVNGFTPAQVTFQRESLNSHNSYRARHCAAALQLDDGLSTISQNYAEYLAATGRFEHSNNGYGENLYMMSSSVAMTTFPGSTATQAWYDEIKYYNFAAGGFSSQTGHFTQVVWKGSQKLGVGIAFSSDRRRVLVVANYNPPGNYMGQFTQNVSPPNC